MQKLTWKEYGGTHPAPAGNRVAADMIRELLDMVGLNVNPNHQRCLAAPPAQIP